MLRPIGPGRRGSKKRSPGRWTRAEPGRGETTVPSVSRSDAARCPVDDLAREFVDAIAGRPEPWADLFQTWARDRELSAAEQRDVRVAILRRRSFGVGRPRP